MILLMGKSRNAMTIPEREERLAQGLRFACSVGQGGSDCGCDQQDQGDP